MRKFANIISRHKCLTTSVNTQFTFTVCHYTTHQNLSVYSPFFRPNERCFFTHINTDCKSYRRGLNWLQNPAVTCGFAAHYHHLQVTFLPTCRSRDVITAIFVIILSPAELRQIFVGVCVNQNVAHSEGRKSV